LKCSKRHTFEEKDLFYGLSLTLDNDVDLAALAAMDGVTVVWPVTAVPRLLSVIYNTPQNSSHRMTKDGADAGACVEVTINSTMYCVPSITGDGNLDVNQPLTMTGVDRIHALGIKRKGIKIAVIDSGVDFRHPSLGGCFGPGCKISFGYCKKYRAGKSCEDHVIKL
jgi:hypothetical protein